MGELVEHVEHPVLASVMGAVLDEVVGPDMIALLRAQPNARSIRQYGGRRSDTNEDTGPSAPPRPFSEQIAGRLVLWTTDARPAYPRTSELRWPA